MNNYYIQKYVKQYLYTGGIIRIIHTSVFSSVKILGHYSIGWHIGGDMVDEYFPNTTILKEEKTG